MNSSVYNRLLALIITSLLLLIGIVLLKGASIIDSTDEQGKLKSYTIYDR